MRFVVFADLHLDSPYAWAGAEVARARRKAVRQTLQRICQLAHNERADALLCGGDLYEHDRFTPDTRNFLRDTFADLHPLPVYLAPGNHDWYGETSLYRQIDWTPNVHVFTEPRLTPAQLADGFTLWGAAHLTPANTDGFLDSGFRAVGDGVHLGLFHGSERGGLVAQGEGKLPHAPFDAEQIPAAGLAHAFCGHFHTPRDARWHTYPGNPDPLTFGETGERGAVIAEVLADGTVRRERRRVAVSEVADVQADLTGADHAGEVRDRVGAALAGRRGVVRVTLAGELDPDVDIRLNDLSTGWPDVEAVMVRLGRVSTGYDLGEIRAEHTVRGQFVRDVEGSELDDEMRRRVITTGLRALSGRTDELEVR